MAKGGNSEDGIVEQMLIATGQGMGAVRISQEAALVLRHLYSRSVSKDMIDEWSTMGTHVLEKSRAMGRHMTFKLTTSGDTVIEREIAKECYEKVAWKNKSRYCNRDGDGDG